MEKWSWGLRPQIGLSFRAILMLASMAFPILHAEELAGPGEEETAEEEEDEFIAQARQPRLLTYIPFDGNHNSYHPEFHDEDEAQLFGDPFPQRYVPGKVGQARDFLDTGLHLAPSLHQGAPSIYPLDETLNLREGTLLLWFCWSANGEERLRFWTGQPGPSKEAFPGVALVNLVTVHQMDSWIWGRVRADAKWHHMALAWSRQEDRLEAYLDGQETGTDRFAGLVPVGAESPALLENDPAQAPFLLLVLGRYFPGAIDEVVIWDKILPLEDIRAAYERGNKGEPSWPATALPQRDTPSRLDRLVLRAAGAPRDVAAREAGMPAPERSPEGPALARYSLAGEWAVQPTGPTSYVPTRLSSDREFCRKRGRLARYEILESPWLSRVLPGPWRAPRNPDDPESEMFLDIPLHGFPAAWLEREFVSPPEWEQRRITLDLEAIGNGYSRNNRVYLNGQLVGRVRAFVREHLHLNPFLRFGQKNRLLFFLSEGELAGDVLISAHESAHVGLGSLFISPNTDAGRVHAQFEVSNLSGKGQEVRLWAALRAWRSDQPPMSQGPFLLQLSPEKKQWHALDLSGEGLSPWTPENTALYELTLNLKDLEDRWLDSSAPHRFGYRTIRIDSKRAQILLNGRPLHFRGVSHNFLQRGRMGPGSDSWFRLMGLNAFRTLSPDLNFPNLDASLAFCDEVGIFCHYNCQNPYGGRVRHEHPFWRNYFQARALYLKNHSSLALWQPWMTGFFPAPWGHPMLIGAVPGVDFDAENPEYRAEKDSMAVVDRIDPDHPMYYYRAGIGGQVRAAMHYQGPGVTLQGKEEWPRYWFQNQSRMGEPFCASEVDLYIFLWDTLWQLGLQTFQPHSHSAYDPFGYGAWYLGESAYATATPKQIALLELTQHLAELERSRNAQLPPPPGPLGEPLEAMGEDEARDEDEILGGRQARPEGTEGDVGPSEDDGQSRQESSGELDITDASARKTLLDQNMNEMLHRTPAVRYRAQWYRRVLRSWRTYGISYLIHCDFSDEYLVTDGQLNEAGLAVAKNNAAVLVYLSHGPEEFVRKDHAYFSGEAIEKQVVICNDRFQTITVEAEWTLKTGEADAAKPLASGQLKANVEPGEVAFLPWRIVGPEASQKIRAWIEVSATVNGERRILPSPSPGQSPGASQSIPVPGLEYGDRLDLQIFPKPNPPRPRSPIFLADTLGDTASMLKQTGVAFTTLSEPFVPPQAGLLLIGRKSLNGKILSCFTSPQMAQAVSRGLNIIVFEQASRWLSGLRMKHLDAHEVFLCDRADPLVAGLEDEDFANWRGASDIIPPYPMPRSIAQYRGLDVPAEASVPDEPDERDPLLARGSGQADDLGDLHSASHWSNHNMVATYAFIKPQKTGFRAILQNGFDLLYSPLIERRIGDGRILYCSLDLTNRYGIDPVATILVNRMLEEYTEIRPKPQRRLVTLGAGPSETLAGKVGAAVTRIETVGEIGRSDLVFIHAADTDALEKLNASLPEVRQALRSGAYFLLVKCGLETRLDFLPFNVSRKEAEVYETFASQGLGAPPWPLLRGLGASDFFWRRTARIVQVLPEVEKARSLSSGMLVEAPVPPGRIVFFQADEDMFQKSYDQVDGERPSGPVLRRWVRTKIYRALSTLLGNLEVAPPAPSSFPSNEYGDWKAVYLERGEPFHPMAHRGW